MATMNEIPTVTANHDLTFTGVVYALSCGFPITIDGIACTRIAVMLIPSYTAAALTGEMVWTVPTLATASVLAASLKPTEQTQRAVDSDHDDSGDSGHEDHETDHDVDTNLEADVDTE